MPACKTEVKPNKMMMMSFLVNWTFPVNTTKPKSKATYLHSDTQSLNYQAYIYLNWNKYISQKSKHIPA